MADFEAKKAEVLSRIEIKSECEMMGMQFKGEPSGTGWVTCFNPYKAEQNPSCGVNVGQDSYRGWFCAFNMAGKPNWAVSFWDLCRDLHPQLSGREWKEIFRHYAESTGVDLKKKTLPKQSNVEFYQSEITNEVRRYLHETRGLTDESIEKYEIGWSTKRERLTFPVYDSHRRLVNIRFHAWKKGQTPKTQNWKGCGTKRLWGVDRLAIDEGNTVAITEGECFPDDAEILTPEGWVQLSKYNNEKVLQVHPNGSAEFAKPLAYIRKPYKGNLIINFQDRGWYSATTPDHNLVSINRKGMWFKHKAKEDVARQCSIPRTTIVNGPGIQLSDDQIRLIIAISADGTIDKRINTGHNGRKPCNDYARFGFAKERKIRRLRKLLKNLNIDASDNIQNDGRTSICFSIPKWASYKVFPPSWIAAASFDQRMLILDEMVYWDGNRVPDRTQTEYSTILRENADFIQAIAHTAGKMSTIMKRQKRQYEWFKLSVLEKNTSSWQTVKKLSAPYSGYVYCVQVPSGAILVRQNDRVYVTGNCDAMMLEQETGLLSVSPTNGAGAFDMTWVKFFHGRHVVLVWDCDKEGRDAVDKIVIPAFRGAVRRGEVLSLKTIWLFDETNNKDRKDFTDFIMKAGGSGKELLRMIDDAVPLEFKEPTVKLPDAIEIESFKDIDLPKYAGKRVSCAIFIHGENSEAYHAPTKILVGDCPLKQKVGCNGRQDWAWTCDSPIQIKAGSRIQLACVSLKDHQVEQHLQKWVCDRRQKCDIIIEHENHITIREVFAHQVITSVADATRLVEKAVYVIGGNLIPIGQYKATGFVYRHPKTQQPTMLIDTLEPQEEDWQAFDLEEKKPLLRELQKMDITTGDILEDLMYNHTHIYKRYDLHLAALLTLCSPLRINLPDEGQIRGWISSIIIGDTGTGKSDVVDVLLGVHQDKKTLDKIGYRVAGQTASRTGITYGLDHDPKRGWKLKAGAMLKQSGQVLNVDEAQDIPEEELKTMADAIDKGRLKIDRIVTREFKAETRCLFTCNPVESQKRRANQKPIAAFQYGCQAIKDIFPVMMVRRVDLCCFAATTDIDLSTFTERKSMPGIISAENFKALVYYAWNLRPEQLIIDDDAYRLICREATRLSEIFGKAADLPIVYAEDFRKTFARICSAAAIADLNSDDDFETITVEKKHIMFMSGELEDWYAAKNCQLDRYARFYRGENTLTKETLIYERLKEHCLDASRRNRVEVALSELVKLTPSSTRSRLSQVYLKDLFEKDRTTIFRDMQPLVRDRLVSSSRGYLPTPKLFQFLHWLKGYDPDFLNWDDPQIETTYGG